MQKTMVTPNDCNEQDDSKDSDDHRLLQQKLSSSFQEEQTEIKLENEEEKKKAITTTKDDDYSQDDNDDPSKLLVSWSDIADDVVTNNDENNETSKSFNDYTSGGSSNNNNWKFPWRKPKVMVEINDDNEHNNKATSSDGNDIYESQQEPKKSIKEVKGSTNDKSNESPLDISNSSTRSSQSNKKLNIWVPPWAKNSESTITTTKEGAIDSMCVESNGQNHNHNIFSKLTESVRNIKVQDVAAAKEDGENKGVTDDFSSSSDRIDNHEKRRSNIASTTENNNNNNSANNHDKDGLMGLNKKIVGFFHMGETAAVKNNSDDFDKRKDTTTTTTTLLLLKTSNGTMKTDPCWKLFQSSSPRNAGFLVQQQPKPSWKRQQLVLVDSKLGYYDMGLINREEDNNSQDRKEKSSTEQIVDTVVNHHKDESKIPVVDVIDLQKGKENITFQVSKSDGAPTQYEIDIYFKKKEEEGDTRWKICFDSKEKEIDWLQALHAAAIDGDTENNHNKDSDVSERQEQEQDNLVAPTMKSIDSSKKRKEDNNSKSLDPSSYEVEASRAQSNDNLHSTTRDVSNVDRDIYVKNEVAGALEEMQGSIVGVVLKETETKDDVVEDVTTKVINPTAPNPMAIYMEDKEVHTSATSSDIESWKAQEVEIEPAVSPTNKEQMEEAATLIARAVGESFRRSKQKKEQALVRDKSDLVDFDSTEVSMEGECWKLRSGFLKKTSWERRRLALAGSKLQYYYITRDESDSISQETPTPGKKKSDKTNKKSSKAAGEIDFTKDNKFNIRDFSGYDGAPTEYGIDIVAKGEVKWKLCFDTNQKRECWVHSLKTAIGRGDDHDLKTTNKVQLSGITNEVTDGINVLKTQYQGNNLDRQRTTSSKGNILQTSTIEGAENKRVSFSRALPKEEAIARKEEAAALIAAAVSESFRRSKKNDKQEQLEQIGRRNRMVKSSKTGGRTEVENDDARKEEAAALIAKAVGESFRRSKKKSRLKHRQVKKLSPENNTMKTSKIKEGLETEGGKAQREEAAALIAKAVGESFRRQKNKGAKPVRAETTAQSSEAIRRRKQPDNDNSAEISESLEGVLFHRRKRGMTAWKMRYVVLSLGEGGSLSVYKIQKKQTKIAAKLRSKLSSSSGAYDGPNLRSLQFQLPADLPWKARDVENDPSAFIIELDISGKGDNLMKRIFPGQEHECSSHSSMDGDIGSLDRNSTAESLDSDGDEQHIDNVNVVDDGELFCDFWNKEDPSTEQTEQLSEATRSSNQKREKLKFFFRCPRRSNEKALWVKAFSKVNRLVLSMENKKGLFGNQKKLLTRVRSEASRQIVRDTMSLETSLQSPNRTAYSAPARTETNMFHLQTHDEIEEISSFKSSKSRVEGPKEQLVKPSYAYPHRWMTREEMRDEMLLPSTNFHDERLFPEKRDDEVGSLRMEVLQCYGLPTLNGSKNEPDTVVYGVSGSYAFTTDVIPNNANPMWLAKMRRACIFPIFHAYARLYIGVFDDDGRNSNSSSLKEDFIGRVVLDVSRFRPGSCYDVTIPLRISSHVYYTRPRGSIRLRIRVDWKNERKALLSYIPKNIKMPLRIRPSSEVTVRCCDQKAFRNVAITVHGTHMPERFSLAKLKSTIKEINYTRIVIQLTVVKAIKDTIAYKNPTISLFIFLGWMHCIYRNSVSLCPPYLAGLVFLNLMRNYAKYNLHGSAARQGFVPPTLEEMCLALLRGSNNSHYIEPLDMHLSQSPSSIDVSRMGDAYVVETHTPVGRTVFDRLGFLHDEHDSIDHISEEQNHLEFPYAISKEYPRINIKDSLSCSTRDTKTNKMKEEREEEERPQTLSDQLDANELLEFLPEEPTSEISETRKNDSIDESRDTTSEDGGISNSTFDLTRPTIVESPLLKLEGAKKRKGPVPPHQNNDVPPEKNEKTLPEELVELKWNLHKLTFHWFNDQTYVIKDANAYFGGKAKKSSSKGKNDPKRELDKALGSGAFSTPNPVVSRIGVLIEPIISAVMGFLCAFRAAFNVLTWQDPFLTFWVAILNAALIVILYFFPWRLFLFIVGVVVFGPQNWVVFKFLEKWIANKEENQLPVSEGTESNEKDDDFENQPVFHCHAQVNQFPNDRRPGPSEVHHVVIPYSPLMYQRFYDWPPERKYARVTSDRVQLPSLDTSDAKKDL